MARLLNQIIIHCSDSTWGTEKDIYSWHVTGNSWDDTGYHFIILNGHINSEFFINLLDGHISPGRDIEIQGAHTKGQNEDSIAICLIGKKSFSQAQLRSLRKLVNFLKSKYQIEFVYPHSKYNAHKTCPNFSVDKVLAYKAGKKTAGTKIVTTVNSLIGLLPAILRIIKLIK